MKDYASMSDFEINRAVGDIIFGGLWCCRPGTSGNESDSWHYGNADATFNPLSPLPDYCNNPADAWPIIEQNKISLTYHHSRGHWSAIFNHENISMHGSPLRAAMIVFLMMKDGE